jgi:hypothetical protein
MVVREGLVRRGCASSVGIGESDRINTRTDRLEDRRNMKFDNVFVQTAPILREGARTTKAAATVQKSESGSVGFCLTDRNT